MSSSRLLTVPREIRDLIYWHCVFEPDGYHFDFHAGGFRTSSGTLVDTPLMYVCKQVNYELGHTAFSVNTLKFSPVLCDRERTKGDSFVYLINTITSIKLRALEVLAYPEFAEYITPDLQAKLKQTHPQLGDLLAFNRDDPAYCSKEASENLRYGFNGGYWGRAQSESRSFIDTAIETLLASPKLKTALNQTDYVTGNLYAEGIPDECERPGTALYRYFNRNPQLLSTLKPWLVPSREALEKLAAGELESDWTTTRQRWFSAAAVAIAFIGSLKQTIRCSIRKVILHENREGIANPQCHGLGFIPFCRENSRLRVIRRVDIWPCTVDLWVALQPFPDELHQLKRIRAPGQSRDWSEDGRAMVCVPLAEWIVEASYLSAAGMPSGCFSVLFDGGDRSDDASSLFELVKWDAAWQKAWTEWNAARSLRYDRSERRVHQSFLSEDLPKAVEDIITGRSLVSCNFSVGQLVDVDLLFPEIDRYMRFRR